MTKLPTGRHTQAIKAATKSAERYLKNKSLKTGIKTNIKKILIAADANEARNMIPQLSKLIDTAASKGAIHKKKASRLKSRIAKKINSETRK